MCKIGIDAGHGGKDPGAIGPTKLYEKNVTMGIAKELESLLMLAGVEVVMSRRDDASMELFERSNLFNKMNCSLAISVHVNSSANSSADYVATFIQGTGGEAEKLATKVQAEMVKATGWTDGGVKVSNLHMTRETKMPAILVECGFISNPAQETELRTKRMQETFARAIATGILQYLGKDKKEAKPVVEDWKVQIMHNAEKVGLIMGDHKPDEPAAKWFVLAVALNLLKVLKGGK